MLLCRYARGLGVNARWLTLAAPWPNSSPSPPVHLHASNGDRGDGGRLADKQRGEPTSTSWLNADNVVDEVRENDVVILPHDLRLLAGSGQGSSGGRVLSSFGGAT